ncbi:MAG: Integrase family protein [Verrucomicrobiales bacterium]|nr:Integrase family protein [Verrucomicrobiales bacterium]
MKANGTELNPPAATLPTVTKASHRRGATYQKVHDASKRPIRGLWKRNDRFYGRLAVEQESGEKQLKWVPLLDGQTKQPVATVAEAVKVFSRLKVQREDNTLPVLKQTPKFSEFVDFYFEHFEKVKDAKEESTLSKEKGHLALWKEHMGGVRLDKIRRRHINAFIKKRQESGTKGRTVNLDVGALRNLLNLAIDEEWIKALPTENLRPLEQKPPVRTLHELEAIKKLCAKAIEVSKNGHQFTDYILLMAYCGSRRNETLRLKWEHVSWSNRQLHVGADRDSKNHENRHVDFNPCLEAHLKDMLKRRAPDSGWLFPSPQRGTKDIAAKTFRETLEAARDAAELPTFGFHDCRHHFISMCVMSGVDYMTIAKWVGHKDGGVLIGKVYGHLNDKHRQEQGKLVRFGPVLLEKAG